MRNSLRALLSGAIDYAGMFPPATLPFEQAVAEYCAYRRTPDAWMLGRFVCPADRLVDLAGSNHAGEIGRISVVASLTAGIPSLLEGLDRVLPQIRALPGSDFLEIRCPTAAVVHPGLLRPIAKRCAAISRPLFVFVELPAADGDAEFERGLTNFLTSLAAHRSEDSASGLTIGFKLRTGGTEATSVPTSELVASAIVACRTRGAVWKATAGLHHPLRHFDPGLGAMTHGFLNLFVAAVLGHVHELDVRQTAEILDDDDPAEFRFTDEHLGWRHLTATTSQIEAARERGLRSFGSCSFDEPRDDLRALGLL